MIRKAPQIGNKILRLKSKPVAVRDIQSKKIQGLITDLIDSMRHYNLVGMAAPQIGVSLAVFVSEIKKSSLKKSSQKPDELRVFINPKIISKSVQKKDMFEGCGSVDFGKIHGPVKRHVSVYIQAYNEKGELFKLKAKDLLSEIIQHEYDHLQGVLCIDKFSDTKKIYFVQK